MEDEKPVTVKFELYGTVGDGEAVLLATAEDDTTEGDIEGKYLHDLAIKPVEAMAAEFLQRATERDVQNLVDKL